MLPLLLSALLQSHSADITTIPAQEFRLEPSHASLTFSVDHLGLTAYTAGFDSIDATLTLDPADPDEAVLMVAIDVPSIDLPSPPEGFREAMLGENWFQAEDHPTISFLSDGVTLTGADSATVTGHMTMLGTSAPVSFDVTFNGVVPAGLFEPHARLGFSASGTLNRSDFGMTYGLPDPGTSFGIGDAVHFTVEAEFIGSLTVD